MELFDYIEVFYNQRCRHSTLGQISPPLSNEERPHMSLGDRTPAEFKAQIKSQSGCIA